MSGILSVNRNIDAIFFIKLNMKMIYYISLKNISINSSEYVSMPLNNRRSHTVPHTAYHMADWLGMLSDCGDKPAVQPFRNRRPDYCGPVLVCACIRIFHRQVEGGICQSGIFT